MRSKLNGADGFHIRPKLQNWIRFIQDSQFHLCPRGAGPTSYRLYESLQTETIPIYIWAQVIPRTSSVRFRLAGTGVLSRANERSPDLPNAWLWLEYIVAPHMMS